MEEMTNRQIVLLTMLVSFVVSTATGIVTVAMLEEAPPIITQTVNRVVERTIERVVTGTSTTQKSVPAPVTTITKEVTIFAKEDDLVVSAVEKNQPRIAKIYAVGSATSSTPDAIGFVISQDGMIVTDAKTLSRISVDSAGYIVIIGDREFVGTQVDLREHADAQIALVRLKISSADTLDAVSFGPKSVQPKIAQSVVVLGGENGIGIYKAAFAKLNIIKAVGTTSPSYLGSIDTSPRIPAGFEGSLVVNLDGQAVGVVVTSGEEPARLTIYPSARIFELVTLVTTESSITPRSALN